MSNLDYWADRIEEAARTGVVILKQNTRHISGARASGVKAKSNLGPLKQEEIENIKRLSAEGKELQEICIETGRSKSSVWRIIENRPRGGGK